jgi:hypothetical protein
MPGKAGPECDQHPIVAFSSLVSAAGTPVTRVGEVMKSSKADPRIVIDYQNCVTLFHALPGISKPFDLVW